MKRTIERALHLFRSSPDINLLDGRLRGKRRRYLRQHSKGFLFGLIPLLLVLASCGGGGDSGGGGGGGGSGGGRQGALSVELALTPGDRQVEVNLVEKGPLVQLLNISTYQLTAIDSDDETMKVEGDRLAEGAFNGSALMGLTNDHNYTFLLRVFYFPVGLAELSNLSLRIDYISANAKNIRDAGGITIGSNWDSDYLADLVDSDDDNDGVNDLDDKGMALDDCPRGELNWRSNRTTDHDGDGCRDEDEDDDDDDDGVNDVLDSCPRGEIGWQSNEMTDRDSDGCRDESEDDDVSDLLADSDSDSVLDGVDIDADGDGLIEIRTAAELDAVRWALNGSGRRLNEMAALNQTGCGNGDTIMACNGYELVRDISLAAYAGGSGWVPLGNDTDPDTRDCQGTPFSGVFDGNGFAVRGLNISRGGEDCIGLFGRLAAGTVIRNLTVEAEAVIGDLEVGGLVGSADGDVRIVSSSSVAREVRGFGAVGGLVGWSNSVEIVSSYSIAGAVGSGGNVGGLVGTGDGAKIVSSYSVAGEVEGFNNGYGGLVGTGDGAKIVSSYSVAGEVIGEENVGGLVGTGPNTEIVSSYSVAGEVIGDRGFVGGLVGSGGNVDSSYWHSAVSVVDNGKGENKTLTDLRMPTNDNAYDASSIYVNWTRGADIDDTTGVEDITIYCDNDLSGAIEAAEMRDGSGAGEDDNRIWDFGGTDDYPAIRCTPGGLDEQRSWWFINTTTNRPQINQDRLDALTSP